MFLLINPARLDTEPAYAPRDESAADAYPHQSAFLHDALRVAAGLPRELPPVDLFKRESPCRSRLCA